MTSIFMNNGIVMPVTILNYSDMKVIYHNDNYIIIGFKSYKKTILFNYKPFINFILNHDIYNLLNKFTHIDVSSTSKGHGFCGGMKRWNFKGLGASHGVSLTHRSIGSTGIRKRPSHTVKGRKMPGHYGHTTVHIKHLKIINSQDFINKNFMNSIVIKGCIPGPKKGIVNVYLRDIYMKNE